MTLCPSFFSDHFTKNMYYGLVLLVISDEEGSIFLVEANNRTI